MRYVSGGAQRLFLVLVWGYVAASGTGAYAEIPGPLCAHLLRTAVDLRAIRLAHRETPRHPFALAPQAFQAKFMRALHISSLVPNGNLSMEGYPQQALYHLWMMGFEGHQIATFFQANLERYLSEQVIPQIHPGFRPESHEGSMLRMHVAAFASVALESSDLDLAQAYLAPLARWNSWYDVAAMGQRSGANRSLLELLETEIDQTWRSLHNLNALTSRIYARIFLLSTHVPSDQEAERWRQKELFLLATQLQSDDWLERVWRRCQDHATPLVRSKQAVAEMMFGLAMEAWIGAGQEPMIIPNGTMHPELVTVRIPHQACRGLNELVDRYRSEGITLSTERSAILTRALSECGNVRVLRELGTELFVQGSATTLTAGFESLEKSAIFLKGLQDRRPLRDLLRHITEALTQDREFIDHAFYNPLPALFFEAEESEALAEMRRILARYFPAELDPFNEEISRLEDEKRNKVRELLPKGFVGAWAQVEQWRAEVGAVSSADPSGVARAEAALKVYHFEEAISGFLAAKSSEGLIRVGDLLMDGIRPTVNFWVWAEYALRAYALAREIEIQAELSSN